MRSGTIYTTIYRVLIILVIGMEILFSIPLVTDSLVGTDEVYIIFSLLVIHLFMLVFGEIFLSKEYIRNIHLLGVVASLFSYIPIFGFIPHLIVIIITVKNRKRIWNKTK